jgi:hypothetical protein
MVPDIAVLDADRKTGIIHVGKPDIFVTPDPGITFTIGKITKDKTRIIITDTEPGYDRWDSHTRERHLHVTERMFATLTGFICEQIQNTDHKEPVAGEEILHDPVAFFGQEPHLKDKPPVAETLQEFAGTVPSASFSYPPKRKIHPGYWFIFAGIILIIAGLYLDWTIHPQIFDDVLLFITSGYADWDKLPQYQDLLYPLSPGFLRLPMVVMQSGSRHQMV